MTRHAILDSDTHRNLRVDTATSAELGDSIMSALVVPIEFRMVQSFYPILFRIDQENGQFSALALFGFEPGENLFLENDRWDARYKPLSVAIQPFLIGLPADGDGPAQIHIDLAHPRADAAEGVRLFSDDGSPSPYLESIAKMLGSLDSGYRESADFFSALAAHDLLEPFSLDVTLANGAQHRLVGFHMINEERLIALGADALGELHADGHLMPIFMALASLSNISELVERKNRRSSNG